ncbi:MAG: hypothetical protein JO251_20920 [Verrucomicrobia bacterium]|nr:hypothetical protein [Verrucomicrobiota bacterium]MBV8417671.1 hypothetical protein [Verrucomicrobiota bacterium]
MLSAPSCAYYQRDGDDEGQTEAFSLLTTRESVYLISSEASLGALTDSQSASVPIAVRDLGPSLDSTQLQRVFETHYTTNSQGMAMGLPISRSIIEAHSGRLWAKVNTPGGAIFQFTLPI